MTGHDFWHQTAFCGFSLARQWPGVFRPTFYDDGTLRPREAATLGRIFPSAQFIGGGQVKERLDELLPVHRFPLLRTLRDEIPMMRKLVDVRAASREWQLYFDSDMLCFHFPNQLFDWNERRIAFSAEDTLYGYCAPKERIDAICERDVQPFANAGVLAMDDRQIDWERVEHWCSRSTATERRHILFEQTLSAALLSGGPQKRLPASDYPVLCHSVDPPPDAVMLHYASHAKPMYFIHEWRRFRALACRVQTP